MNEETFEPQPASQDVTGDAELTELDRAILDFESQLWKKTAIKERAITQQLGLAPLKYYQRLVMLAKSPAASEYAPVTVRRLNEAFAQKPSRRLG